MHGRRGWAEGAAIIHVVPQVFSADRYEFVSHDTTLTLPLFLFLPLDKKVINVFVLDRNRSDDTLIRVGRLRMHLWYEVKLATVYQAQTIFW